MRCSNIISSKITWYWKLKWANVSSHLGITSSPQLQRKKIYEKLPHNRRFVASKISHMCSHNHWCIYTFSNFSHQTFIGHNGLQPCHTCQHRMTYDCALKLEGQRASLTLQKKENWRHEQILAIQKCNSQPRNVHIMVKIAQTKTPKRA